jgi:hypothetical protein
VPEVDLALGILSPKYLAMQHGVLLYPGMSCGGLGRTTTSIEVHAFSKPEALLVNQSEILSSRIPCN